MSVNKYNSETKELELIAGKVSAPIDDSIPSTDKVYSSSKVENIIKDFTEIESIESVDSFWFKENCVKYARCQLVALQPHYTVELLNYYGSNPNTGIHHVRAVQIATYSASGGAGNLLIRKGDWNEDTSSNITWSDWKQLATTDDVYGTELTANEDLNNILTRKSTSGTAIAQSLINRPSDSSATECCVYFDSCGTSNLYGVQHFVGINAAANTYNEWVRIKNDSSWNAWKKLF